MNSSKLGKTALLFTGLLWTGCGLGAAPGEVSQAIDALLLTADQGTWSGTYDSMTTPAFREKVSKEEYEKIGRAIHDRLGKFVSKDTKSFFFRSMNGVSSVEATYEAQFAQGKGTIRTTMVKLDGSWRVFGFWISSPELLESPSLPCAGCGKPRPKDAAFCPACGKKVDPTPSPAQGK